MISDKESVLKKTIRMVGTRRQWLGMIEPSSSLESGQKGGHHFFSLHFNLRRLRKNLKANIHQDVVYIVPFRISSKSSKVLLRNFEKRTLNFCPESIYSK
jgi:hypothetical protein